MSLQAPATENLPDAADSADADTQRLSLAQRTRKALRGIKLGIRAYSSFFVQFFFAAVVLAAGLVLRCSRLEWCILIACIASVLCADLFHSAVETIVGGLDPAAKRRADAALDMAAGAVLLARLAAAVIGGIILFSRLSALLRGHIDA
ncbi:MAG TPA: diacylglycerol kinase [Gemmataceae bacterium]|jgi:diacylglycerol kinase|nr:diacylglycerol kinase [Gemmataceae bacterium]